MATTGDDVHRLLPWGVAAIPEVVGDLESLLISQARQLGAVTCDVVVFGRRDRFKSASVGEAFKAAQREGVRVRRVEIVARYQFGVEVSIVLNQRPGRHSHVTATGDDESRTLRVGLAQQCVAVASRATWGRRGRAMRRSLIALILSIVASIAAAVVWDWWPDRQHGDPRPVSSQSERAADHELLHLGGALDDAQHAQVPQRRLDAAFLQ